MFVSGATGFIGSRLAERLAAEGAHVKMLVRDPVKGRSLSNKGINIYWGDITYPESLPPAMRGCQIVFHCAAATGGSIEEAQAGNVVGTRNIVECARQAGVQRVVHISSIAVYGSDLPPIVDETQPYAKKGSAYALTKAEGEQVALHLGKELGVQVVVARPTCVYGPGSPTWTLRFFRKIQNERIPLVKGGAGIVNLVYIDDVVDALLLAALSDSAVGESFNISGQPVTWLDYLGRFAQFCNKPVPPSFPVWKAGVMNSFEVWQFRFTRRPAKIEWSDIELMCNQTVFSINKAGKLLTYRPQVSFEKGMSSTSRWLAENGYLVDPLDC